MMLPMIKLPTKVTRAIGKLTFKTARAKPGICIVVGLIVGGSAVVMAAVDTWKGKDKLSNDIQQIKALKEPEPQEDVKEDAVLVSEEEKKTQLIAARKQFAIDILKTYWKPVLLSSGSLILILHGHKLYKHQLAELGAMYTALLESYRRYRQNVVNDLGAEKDQEYMYGLKKVETVDSETGEVNEKYIPVACGHSRYARWLDEGIWDNSAGVWIWENTLYNRNKGMMESQLRQIQNECNDILTKRGYMTLNQVYEKLRLPPSEEGQHVGWVKGGLANGIPSDDFIDFGIFDDGKYGAKYQLPVNRKWLDYRSEQAYPLLDFNVVCIDSIWNDIYEYDNRSLAAYDKRRTLFKGGSAESLDRWFKHSEYMESIGR